MVATMTRRCGRFSHRTGIRPGLTRERARASTDVHLAGAASQRRAHGPFLLLLIRGAMRTLRRSMVAVYPICLLAVALVVWSAAAEARAESTIRVGYYDMTVGAGVPGEQ